MVPGSHSLLWALDPLREALEGGVTLLCEGSDDHSRISAQLELLEPERRPQLITSTGNSARAILRLGRRTPGISRPGVIRVVSWPPLSAMILLPACDC